MWPPECHRSGSGWSQQFSDHNANWREQRGGDRSGLTSAVWACASHNVQVPRGVFRPRGGPKPLFQQKENSHVPLYSQDHFRSNPFSRHRSNSSGERNIDHPQSDVRHFTIPHCDPSTFCIGAAACAGAKSGHTRVFAVDPQTFGRAATTDHSWKPSGICTAPPACGVCRFPF